MITVPVRLCNRTAYLRPPTKEVALQLRDAFAFHPANYFFNPKYRAGSWDGLIRLIRNGTMAAGAFLAMQNQVEEELKIHFEITDERRRPVFHPFLANYTVPEVTIRPYQRDCVKAMIQHSGTGGLVLNATGTGKTFIAGLFFRLLRGSACFLVDELTLLDQAKEGIEKVIGEKVGIIGNSQFEPRRITIATVQTVHKHRMAPRFKQWSKALEVMIIDELHKALNRRSFETVRAISPLAVYGLTATLAMQKDHVRIPAQSICGPQIYHYSYEDGLAENYLTPGVAIGVDLCRTVVKTRKMAGYQKDYESRIVRSRRRNEVIVGLVRELHRKGYFIGVLVEWIDHLNLLSAMLKDIPHEVIFGQVKREERKAAKKNFEDGKIRLFLANRVFTKGIDLSRLDALIDAAAMSSKEDVQQKFGRGVRLRFGKLGLLYFDIGDRRPKNSENRFGKATRARRRALAELGVPLLRVRAGEDPALIVEQAESFLEKYLKTRKMSA